MGRVVEARADVLRFEPATPTNAYTAEVGRLGGAQYQGGHLIGRRFAGFAEGATLSPQLGTLNNGAYRAMEDGWQSALDPALGGSAGTITDVKVTAVFDPGNNTIVPDRFEVRWLQDGVPVNPPPFENRL